MNLRYPLSFLIAITFVFAAQIADAQTRSYNKICKPSAAKSSPKWYAGIGFARTTFEAKNSELTYEVFPQTAKLNLGYNIGNHFALEGIINIGLAEGDHSANILGGKRILETNIDTISSVLARINFFGYKKRNRAISPYLAIGYSHFEASANITTRLDQTTNEIVTNNSDSSVSFTLGAKLKTPKMRKSWINIEYASWYDGTTDSSEITLSGLSISYAHSF